MRFIFVPYIGAFGGVERLILSLSGFLHRSRIDHKVVCFRDTINLASYADWPIVVDELQPARSSLSEAKTLRRYCHDTSGDDLLLFDLKGAFYACLANLRGFHLHLTDPPSLLAGESSRSSRAYRRWSKDSRHTSLRHWLVGEAVQIINRRGVRRAKSVIVMTQRISAELQALYGVKPQVIRPGVSSVHSVEARQKLHSETLTMLSVSRLETSKRINLAIDALAELSQSAMDQIQPWQLEIIGSGPARSELENHAVQRNVNHCVKFLGRVSDEELEAAYQRADLFVMPAVQGYGLPALEALQRGIPVVLHCESGVSEILHDSPWTEIIEESQQLAGAIERLGNRIRDAVLTLQNRPFVPTDVQWAEQIARACGWL